MSSMSDERNRPPRPCPPKRRRRRSSEGVLGANRGERPGPDTPHRHGTHVPVAADRGGPDTGPAVWNVRIRVVRRRGAGGTPGPGAVQGAQPSPRGADRADVGPPGADTDAVLLRGSGRRHDLVDRGGGGRRVLLLDSRL